MNATAKTAARPATEPSPPSAADAIAVLGAALAEGRSQLTADQQTIVARGRAAASRHEERSIVDLGQELERLAGAHQLQAQAAAADRARAQRKSAADLRPVAWEQIPPFLQLAYVLVEELEGGRSTSRGRQLCRLLEGLCGDFAETPNVPDCFRPLAPEHP